MKRHGFSLVELIIYLALFLLITMLISSFLSTTYKNTFNYNKKIHQALNLYTSRDLIVQDLRRAACNKKWWSAADKELIFRIEDTKEDVGWIIKKKKLMRYAGSYNRSRHVWNKKIVSVVANDVDAFIFDLHEYSESSYIKFVTGQLFSKSLETMLRLIVVLQNKIV